MNQSAHSETILSQDDGTYVAFYGPFVLRTAFQPIFSLTEGRLIIRACEALIRPTKRGVDVSPGVLFSAVVPDDRAMVDALCRQLHIMNMSRLERPDTNLFLNFDPSAFNDESVTAREADRIAEGAEAVGVATSRLVCEIVEKRESTEDALLAFARNFRDRGFMLAVDDYGAAGSDIGRIDKIGPDIVKFDAEWVLRYMQSDAGIDLLGEMVEKFKTREISTLFEGLQTPDQVDIALSLNIDLLQGYALGRPELMPTHFNVNYPTSGTPREVSGARARAIPDPTPQPDNGLDEPVRLRNEDRGDRPEPARPAQAATARPGRPNTPFGRRGR